MRTNGGNVAIERIIYLTRPPIRRPISSHGGRIEKPRDPDIRGRPRPRSTDPPRPIRVGGAKLTGLRNDHDERG